MSARSALPPSHPAGPATARRRSGRADLRQDLFAAKVQDRHRPARRQQRRRLRQRHRPAGDLRELECRRLQRARGRQLRRHAQCEENVPGRRAADVLHRGRPRRRPVHRDRESAARFRQSGRPQSRPHEVPHPRLGPRPLPQQGRRVLRRLAGAAATGRRPRLQRRHGLARARRRPLVLRPQHRKRPHQRHDTECS